MSELSTFRKKLHSEPELSGKEKHTAEKITSELKKTHPSKIITNLGGTGVAAIFNGKSDGKTIMFRAELDALPIQETNTFEHASKTKGVSHKCGHDGHATILIGLAKKIVENPIKKGKVILLFQPAEENGAGAKAVLEDPKFSEIKPDFIFALHNVPGFKKGEIVCKTGTFTPSVSSIAIELQGKTAHAAEPENGFNPDGTISELISSIKNLAIPDEKSDDFTVITTVYANLGSKNYGISAGKGEVHFTVRCWTPDKLEAVKKEIVRLVGEIAKKHHLKPSTEWIYEFSANKNDETAFSTIKKAALQNDFDFLEKATPFKWGEDFGLFTQHFKGAMFGLGAGEKTPALHNPDYDFPDELIPYGVKMFHAIFTNIGHD
ncbi:MAG TPA: amidohydrolase [Flavobacteriaceae bacterium]|nr:amidohydrolase [Flavobacteriaceae bacterium]